MKKVISILLVSIMILTSCGSKNSQQAEEKKDSETFTVGMEAMYAPYNWTQTDDKNGAVPIADTKEFANGYDVQVAKKIADSLGKKLVIQKMEWSGLIPALQAGYIDAIIGGMSPTDKRREEIDFSDLYWKSDLIVVVKKDSKYKDAKSINDFAGAKLTGQLNTFHYDVLDQMPGIDKQDPIGDFSQERVALKSGIIDGYVAELPEGLSITKAVDDFTYVSFEEGKGFDVSDSDIGIAVGLKKDNTELKDKINEFLKTLSQEDRQKLMEEALSVQPISEAN